MRLITPIVPCLRMYLHDYIPAKTRKRNPPKEYFSLAMKADETGFVGLADLCKKLAVATLEQRTLIKEDFELYPDIKITKEGIFAHIRDYYKWQNYTHIRDLPCGLIYQQNKILHMINLMPLSDSMIFVTVLEHRCVK
ncbi:hypothetical protein HYW75_05575 [Candidatus Pacearchaeota archaeon]|nr:hypothetical protein [Candidatus Pacearchaeota archaeon]